VIGTNIVRENPGIRVNVGCGTAPTPGWTNFDNSLSVRIARFPTLSVALRGLRLLSESSAKLAGPRHHLWIYDDKSLAQLIRPIQTGSFAEAAVVLPGFTRIGEPDRLNLSERPSESVHA
jgi:hypothetical protein